MILVLILGLHLEKDASIGLHQEKRIISGQDPSQGPGGKCHMMDFCLYIQTLSPTFWHKNLVDLLFWDRSFPFILKLKSKLLHSNQIHSLENQLNTKQNTFIQVKSSYDWIEHCVK